MQLILRHKTNQMYVYRPEVHIPGASRLRRRLGGLSTLNWRFFPAHLVKEDTRLQCTNVGSNDVVSEVHASTS